MQRAVFLAAVAAFQAGCGLVSGPADEGPPWTDSAQTFCSDLTGTQNARVWSTPGSVFVALKVYCSPGSDVPCNEAARLQGSAFTVYENHGDGWRMRHRDVPPTGNEYLTGFADGRVVFGTIDCAVLSVDGAGGATCLHPDLGDHVLDVHAAAEDSVVALRTGGQRFRVDLVRLEHGGVSVLDSWTEPSWRPAARASSCRVRPVHRSC
jgi:hypothetical protein